MLQIGIGTLEEIDVGQHRQTGSSADLVTGRDLGRQERVANDALARRGLLHFGDHRWLLGVHALLERRREAPHRVGDRGLLLQLCRADSTAALGNLLELARYDLLQHCRHTHF